MTRNAILLAGAAALAVVAGAAGARAQAQAQAQAQTQGQPVVLMVPGGFVEVLAAPVHRGVTQVPAWAVADSPFAMMQRLSAEMDAQAAAMARMQTMPAGFGPLPPGSSGVTMVTTISGSGACMESVRMVYGGQGAAPQVVSSRSGGCGPMNAAPSVPAAQPQLPARPLAHLLEVRNGGPATAPELVTPIAAPKG
jgi:hypothetical protein